MERINERATETAKKIRKELKKAFPEIKFSVRSSTFSMGSSVTVSYTDGVPQKEVEEIVNRFQSTSFCGMDDSTTYHGYMYEGKLYIGAKFVSVSRKLTEEYREQIKNKMVEINGEVSDWDLSYKRLFEEAELALISPEEVEVVEEVVEEVEVLTIETEASEEVEESREELRNKIKNMWEEIGFFYTEPVEEEKEEAPKAPDIGGKVVNFQDYKNAKCGG